MQACDKRKAMLITAMAVTALLPLAFLDVDEPTAALLITKALAKIG